MKVSRIFLQPKLPQTPQDQLLGLIPSVAEVQIVNLKLLRSQIERQPEAHLEALHVGDHPPVEAHQWRACVIVEVELKLSG